MNFIEHGFMLDFVGKKGSSYETLTYGWMKIIALDKKSTQMKNFLQMESTIWNDSHMDGIEFAEFCDMDELTTWMKQYHEDEFEDINGFDCMDGAGTCG